jgi:hypothetical protein
MRRLRLLPATLGVLSAMIAAPAPGQQDLTARALYSYTLFDSEAFSNSGFTQTYDLGFARQISTPLSYQIRLRMQQSDGRSGSELNDKDARQRFFEPELRVGYTPFSSLQLGADWRGFRASSEVGGERHSSRNDRWTGSLGWQPTSTISLGAGVERDDLSGAGGADQTRDRLTESIQFQKSTFLFGESGSYSRLLVPGADFERTEKQVQLQGRYSVSFLDNRATLSSELTGGWTRLEENSRTGEPVSVPSAASIARALFAFDETPAEDRDHPLVEMPALVDRNYGQATGIALGTDGSSFQNIGADMRRFQALDTFRIHVRDAAGHPVPVGGLIRWDVYASDDGIVWALVPGGASSSYVPAGGYYEVTFVSVTSRWFKVVNFGTNSAPTYVTELEAFFHTTLAATEKRTTRLQFQTAFASLTGRPADWLHFGYSFLANRYRTNPEAAASLTSADVQHSAYLEIHPLQPLALVAQYRREDVRQGGGLDRTHQTQSGQVKYDANTNLHLALEASLNRDTREDFQGEIRTKIFRGYLDARPLQAIGVTLDGGFADQDVGFGATQRRRFLDLRGYTQLTDSLRLTLEANVDRLSNAGLSVPGVGVRPSRSERIYGGGDYRPSDRLAFSARVGRTVSDSTSLSLQHYRFEWNPFAGGAVTLGTTFDEDVDQNDLRRRFRRVQLNPRWMLNRHSSLELNYSYYRAWSETPIGPTRTISTRSLYLTLVLSL